MRRTTRTMAQLPLHSLPLPPVAARLTHALQSVPSHHPTFSSVLDANPSSLRRSIVYPSGHFAHVTPLPIEFPYKLPVKVNDEGEKELAVGVEEWLGAYEPTVKQDATGLYSNAQRSWPATLVGFSSACADEVLPHLATGDSVDVVQRDYPAGTGGKEDASLGSDEARESLVSLLSGREVRMDLEDEEDGLKPWSLRYGGRQFGQWASQLGDGRAISLCETALPSGEIQEIQLKGSGRTPFSRHADGLAVLRSSIREFLASEHASAFPSTSMPTSRSLSLVLLPELKVLREYGPEKGAIVSRIAPSFLRIGSFEMLNPPTDQFMFFYSRPGYEKPKPEWDNLRVLGAFVRLKLGMDEGAGTWEMVREVTRRNARMVAGWQAWGFQHGVINTDNVSVLGLTIDYGPYAYMDIFKSSHVCNHSDEEGRYAYDKQPAMVFYAMSALLKANAELVGYEMTQAGAPAREGWEAEVGQKGPEWRKAALEREGELKKEFDEVYEAQYRELMGKRLGLIDPTPSDVTTLVEPLLELMERHSLDFTSTLRTLTQFPTVRTDDLIERVLDNSTMCDLVRATDDFERWLGRYAARLEQGARTEEERRAWNPRFALRQWVLEEAIERMQKGQPDARRHLARVLKMSLKPFEQWGREGVWDESKLTEDEKEERRLCGLGDDDKLGFQCSCSS